MAFPKLIEDQLTTALTSSDISHVNRGSGEVAYFAGDDAQQAANAIFGAGCWSFEILDRQYRPEVHLYECHGRVTVHLPDATPVRREDLGVCIAASTYEKGPDGRRLPGGQEYPPTPEAHRTAILGAATNALKGALQSFGPRFGLGLADTAEGGGDPTETPLCLCGDYAKYVTWNKNGREGYAFFCAKWKEDPTKCDFKKFLKAPFEGDNSMAGKKPPPTATTKPAAPKPPAEQAEPAAPDQAFLRGVLRSRGLDQPSQSGWVKLALDHLHVGWSQLDAARWQALLAMARAAQPGQPPAAPAVTVPAA